ncbi:MAG: HNH endonuclease [Candidatus Hodarchaeota archaeon]
MIFNHKLNPGDTISNQVLAEIFKCSTQGGMRRSHATNTLVIVSDHTKSIYEDRWKKDILHYTGMGTTGDQDINFQQNKTLAESESNKVEIYLFEVFEPNRYVFRGQVKLDDKPYQEKQPDIGDNLRWVWIFPLKLVEKDASKSLDQTLIDKRQERKEKEARRLSDQELEKRARHSKKGVGTRSVVTKSYERNVYVAELAKRYAKGFCQLCENPAPFEDKNGIPFLEVHHIKWLSKGGKDVIENNIALCPNCHRKMHVLNLEPDREKLKAIALGQRGNNKNWLLEGE